MAFLPTMEGHGKGNGVNMSVSEMIKELAEVSEKRIRLLNALEGYKSPRDGALISQARRQIRSLSKRRGALLTKIHKQEVNLGEHLPTQT
jgi:hypothetical protein